MKVLFRCLPIRGLCAIVLFMILWQTGSAQNVGIGITNPTHKLSIQSLADINLLRLIGPYSEFGYGSRLNFGDGDYVYFEEDEDDNLTIYGSTRTAIMGGDVGIGTTTPGAKLEVAGDVRVNGTISNVTDPVDAQDAATKAYVDLITSPAYTIGLWPELGGYVVWVSADGRHGLVAETEDQGSSNWYAAHNIVSNPGNHSVDGENFRNWRLPTKYELSEMLLEQNNIGGFSGGDYWSSTEYSNDLSWEQNSGNGDQYGNYKTDPSDVRAVRDF